MEESNHWDITIGPNRSIFNVDLRSVWKYRDLIILFVKRDFVAVYKQTLLGPLWFFIQPIFTTITFTIIFGKIANINTGTIPQVLFYMTGITMWNYFSDCLNKTSNTFRSNQHIFGKVYFPRIIVPLSVIITSLLKFFVQLIMLMCFWVYYRNVSNNINPQISLALFPILVLIMAFLSLGIGMIISSLTTKYRDFSFLIAFGVQLLMYASPIVYPISIIPEKYKWYIMLNPMSSIIETFKHGLLGEGYYNPLWLGYSFGFTVIIFLLGTFIFNKVERSFIDTV